MVARLVRAAGEGGNEFSSAPDAELVEHGVEVFLERVRRDLEFVHDGAGRPALEDQRCYSGLCWGESVCGEYQGAHLWGAGGIEDHGDLVSGRAGER